MTSDNSISLGEFLRQERERRGVTLEQVASATKISVRMLHALESDQYAEMPAKPFIRGFVTSYARFVGLDPHEILTRFGDFIELKAHDRPSREAGHSGYAFEKREGEQSRTVLWVIMGSFVLLGGLLLFVLKPSLKHHKPSHADRLRAVHATATPSAPLALASAIPSPAPLGSPMPAPAPKAGAPVPAAPAAHPSPAPSPAPALLGPLRLENLSAPKPSKPDPLNSGTDLSASEIKHKVVVKALADIFVRYRVDQKAPMRIVLRKDRVLVLRARDVVRVQVSDPKSATVNANGKGAKLVAGEKNAASHPSGQTLFFPADSAEKANDPFPNDKPLPASPPPTLRAATPAPSPAP